MQIIEFLIGLFGSPTYSRAADPSVETSTFEPIPPPNGLMATIGSDISVPFSSSGWQRKRALRSALGCAQARTTFPTILATTILEYIQVADHYAPAAARKGFRI